MSECLTAVPSVASTTDRAVDRWFYIGMAIATTPSRWMVNAAARRAPVTGLAVVHGIVFLIWLQLFLAQTVLVATRRMEVHRRLETVTTLLAPVLIVLGYMTVIPMLKRGFDLSRDLHIEVEPFREAVFPLGDLVIFGVLIAPGYWYRRRPDVHRRLMLLGTVGGLMPAPLADLIGHFSPSPAGRIILVPIAMFLFASAVYDRVRLGRIHPVSLWGAIAIFVYNILLAALLGPSALWHRFVGRLVG
jgi:hypothetical protein